MQSFDLVVVSHLRWSYVWQRPQHLISRLANYHRVLFVEEPVAAEDTGDCPVPYLQKVSENVTVLRPRLTSEQIGDSALWLWPCRHEIADQVRKAIGRTGINAAALWFYTPLPGFLIEAIDPGLIVYDIMDELANFKFAPPDLRERERRLINRCDMVYTGGASLYEAKKSLHPFTYLFPSGVDYPHFSSACSEQTTVPEWLDALDQPRATYIGVIDERLDYETVRRMACAWPNVQFVMCGPIAKIDEADLPKSDNLHYAGQQPYSELPRILRGSDICLMPFAQNDSTRYISPTKTLEYMAAHKPIVSTAIADVARFYSDIVYLAGSPDEFVEQIGAALNEAPDIRERNRKREERILAEQAWDAIADNMESLLQAEWLRKSGLNLARALDYAPPDSAAPCIPTRASALHVPGGD
ncbi:MAG TPA: glycosyltransferase [Chthonomonadales bacterium]|nr:glycosyltransferase [Chthonomonadales bacterium]